MEKLVLDNFAEPHELQAVLNAWPSPEDPSWRGHSHANSKNKKSIGKLMHIPQVARTLLMRLNGQAMIDNLSQHFQRDLIPDPWMITKGEIFGGGLHQIDTDGFLNTHVDYNWHSGVYRRLNLLLYLNDWKPGDGGELELNGEIIEPVFNRAVVFETTEDSWHGHPNPWKGKEPRKSLAVYYYSGEGESVPAHSTIYRSHVGAR